ncbi:phosphoribosylaminoimidazolesuccinocarboxamide synthase, partial [Bacillus pseudomycoides]|uniref:phosphoribosylaminoimidazolesuccinocarboxamide synthase n=1 Tax=Bacillus pseudomycoides TaxID=64104 RepID=UPI00284FB950
IIPLEVATRNVIAVSLSKRLEMEEGTVLAAPIVEFYSKDDDIGDPLVTEDHIRVLNVATTEQVSTLRETALQINQVL